MDRGLPGATRLTTGVRAVAAVSGGPDSTALLVWLVESGVDVAAAHYDHALRDGSERDAEHVAALCDRLGVPLLRERRAEPLPAGSVQAAARALRYAFLERALAATGRDVVCLGHTADDVVEGALLHLLRGSGLAGLRGMPRSRGPIVRPLLDVWRSDVEHYLAARGLEPVRDPSNGDTVRYARARVRFHLLPALERDRPGMTRRLRAAAASAAALQDRLEAEAARLVGAGPARRTTFHRATRAGIPRCGDSSATDRAGSARQALRGVWRRARGAPPSRGGADRGVPAARPAHAARGSARHTQAAGH